MEDVHDGGGVIRRTTDYEFGMNGCGDGSGRVMSAEKSLMMTDEVIFLEPGQEKAQNIVKAISNQNAGEVVQLLSLEGPLRLSDIAQRLDMSINAAKYHIENLMHAGILEISNTRYSVKGKKVKIYRLKNQVFIVAPNMNSIADVQRTLMKYCAALGVFAIVFCGALIQPFFRLPSVPLQISGSIHPGSVAPASMLAGNSVIPALIIAAAVTLLLLVIYEMHTLWKNRRLPA
ncbi:MAG: helix-turn-helix domain-containing protein [Methanoregula sp.]|jgi:DNA-binding transcriptional ArsR family regulator